MLVYSCLTRAENPSISRSFVIPFTFDEKAFWSVNLSDRCFTLLTCFGGMAWYAHLLLSLPILERCGIMDGHRARVFNAPGACRRHDASTSFLTCFLTFTASCSCLEPGGVRETLPFVSSRLCPQILNGSLPLQLQELALPECPSI